MSGDHTQAFLFMLNRPEPIRQSSLLMVLATGISDGPTLMAGLKSLAEESGQPWGGRILQLRALLEAGHPLTDSLRSVGGLLPEQSMIAIQVAEETNSLKQVLGEEARRLMRSETTVTGVQPGLPETIAWLLAMAFVCQSIVGFLLIFIVPKLKAIFQGFELELPESTKTLINIADAGSQNWFLIAFPSASLLITAAVILGRSHIRFLSTGHVPLSRHFPRYWTPLILRSLSIVAAARKSLADGVHQIQKEMRPGKAAQKLSAVRQRLNGGEECWTALHMHGFLKRNEAEFLNSACRTRHLDWGLLHLSHTLERRRERLTQLCISLLQPVAIICGGCVVGFVVVAMFMPLVKMIHELS